MAQKKNVYVPAVKNNWQTKGGASGSAREREEELYGSGQAIDNPIYAGTETSPAFPVAVQTPQLNASRGINPQHQASFDPTMDVPMPQPTPGTREAWEANGDTWEGVYGRLRGQYGRRMDLERQLAEAEEAVRVEQQLGNAAGIPTQSYLQADQKAREAREALAALGDNYDREDYQRLLNQLTTGYGAEIATDEQRQRMLDYLDPMLRRTATETRQDAPASAIASFVDIVASPFAFGSDRFANAAQKARADWEDSSRRYRQLQEQVRGMGQFASSAEDVARNVTRSGIDQFSGGFANLVKMADDMLGVDPDNANWAYIGRWANNMLREKEEARQSYERAMTNASPAGRYAADLGVSTVAAIPNAAMAVMSGGASTATTASLSANAAQMAGNIGLMDTVSTAVRSMAENPIFWESFATATGNGYESAMAKGADQNRAIMFATINGLVNAAIEMGGGIETLPSNWNNETVMSAILKWVQSANDEGMEEIKQGIVERGLENLILGADNKWASGSDPNAVLSLAGAMQEWFGGFFVGSLLGGFQSVNEIRSAADARSAAQQINEWAAQNLPQEYRPAPLDLGLAAPDLVQRYAGEVALAEINYIAALSEQQGDVRTSTNPAEVMANIGGITAENEAATAQVRNMLSQPLNRSQANKIINDPAMRAAYEAVTGTTLPNVKGEAARAVMEYSQQQAKAAAEDAQRYSQMPNRTNIAYDDIDARNAAQMETHNRMVESGNVVDLTDAVNANGEFYPDLRSMPRKERGPILKRLKNEVKSILSNYLSGLRDITYQFDTNGEMVEARLTGTGIREVLKGLTQDRASMLGASDQIFRSAEYMYSTGSSHGNEDVVGWDYYYVPVRIGDAITGVRIAVRNYVDKMSNSTENQIYNWGIKSNETESMTRGSLGEVTRTSDFGPSDSVSPTQPIPQNGAGVNPLAQTILNPQQNIDNASDLQYNDPDGGDTFGSERTGSEGGTGQLSLVHAEGDSNVPFGGQELPRDQAGLRGLGALNDTQRQTLTDRGIVYFDTQDVSGNNAAFSNALEEGKASQKYGPFVDSKSEEDLDGMKLFLAENGAGGFAVRSDGDVEAVFTKRGVAPPHSAAGLVIGCVAQGGTKLDCYGIVLVNNYAKGGFVPVAQVDWNQDYAPPGWTPEIGTPQVYVMMHNGDSADTVAANFGEYKLWTQAELDALPRFTGENGYDNALAYRDMLLERQQAQQSQAAQTTAETGPVETEAAQPEGRGSMNLRPDTGAEPGTPQTRLSQTAETVRDAQATPAEFAALIDQDIEKGGFRYIPITNDATVQKATDRITKDGWSATLRNWSNDVRRGVTGAEMSAVGALLYNNAVNSGDTKLAMDILSDYMTMGRNTARGLQAMKIIQNLSPDTRLYMIERQVDKLSEQLLSKVPDGIQISETLKEQYRNATSDEVRDQVLDAMAQEVADQVPATVKDKWTALRYLNMLGNFRTQGRNLIGNSIMALTTMNKNIVLRGLESLASTLSGGNYERSVSLSVDPKFRQACMEEFRENEAFISGEGKYSDTKNAGDEFMGRVEDKRQIFGFKPLEWYRRATNWATDAGDKIFIGPRYARSLAGYLTANGMDVETYTGIRDGSIQPTADQTALLERARNFAMKEAQESTFHDSNTLSNWVAKAGRGPNTPSFVRVLAEGLMPFRKTPANVAVRMFEYSPLGAVDTIVKAVKARNPDNDISTTQVMNSLAKTLTGTGIFFLGMLMRSAGRLRGHEDDDKQSAFDSLRGQQDYSYVTADGDSYTLDWASPVAGTLFMGSQMYDILQDGDIKLEDMGEVVTRMGDPLVQMSMLQGLRDALDALKYGDTNSIGSLALNMALSYLTQGLTNTLGGQIERTAQGGRYTTFRDSDTQFGRTMQQWLGKTLEKVPGIDYNQVEYVDAWGRTQDGGNAFARAFGNFVSPGYAAQNNSTDVDDELQRLYDAGETNVFPQRIGMSETVSLYDSSGTKTGERNMTADEYVTFQKVMGQTSLEMVRDLMNSDMYDDMTDDAKAAAISSIYQYAKNLAAQEVEPSTKKVYEDVSSLSNIGAFYGTQAAFNTAANNERNRDYDALDNLMETYGDLPADVRALLEEKKPELAKVYAASEAGISSEDYYSMTDTIKGLTAPEGYVNPPVWQQFEAIGQSNLSMEEQDFFAGLYLHHSDTGGMSTYEKYMACREVDYRPRDIATFYRIYTVTEGTDANGDGRADNGTKKKNIIAAAMAYGFSERQATELYNMFNKGSWTGK